MSRPQEILTEQCRSCIGQELLDTAALDPDDLLHGVGQHGLRLVHDGKIALVEDEQGANVDAGRLGAAVYCITPDAGSPDARSCSSPAGPPP